MCLTKVFAHKVLDMAYQQVEHSSNSINLCRSSPKGWSFGAWRIKEVIFSIWVTYFSNPTYSLFFSLLYLRIYYSVFIDFFPFPMVIFFKHPYFFSFWEEEKKQPHISNNPIFQRSYSFNINCIISSLISFNSNPIIVPLNKLKKKKLIVSFGGSPNPIWSG